MESVDVSQSDSTNSLVPEMGQKGGNSLSNPLQFPSPESTQPASGEASSISDDAALNAATWFAKEQLDSFASDEDFLSNMEQAFGDDWQPQQAEDLIQDLASGDAMPEVKVMPGSDLKANGIGHFVDQELNSGDSPGDEGDIFQQLVEDKAISDSELVDLKAEDDSGTVALEGEEFSVETASNLTPLSLSSLTASTLSDAPTDSPRSRYEQDEPRITLNPKTSTDPEEYELYSKGNGISLGETHEFADFENHTEVWASGNDIGFSFNEKDADGYAANPIDFEVVSKATTEGNDYVLFDGSDGSEYKLDFYTGPMYGPGQGPSKVV
ncbi:MAG: hypothetical protein BRC34_13235 [Cyanobacteria bacterium QH_1_48_107]|nr:MAG: hypothetical protein BRC34_13235 [Cyanobacteria bacterium QH_1_48_107]